MRHYKLRPGTSCWYSPQYPILRDLWSSIVTTTGAIYANDEYFPTTTDNWCDFTENDLMHRSGTYGSLMEWFYFYFRDQDGETGILGVQAHSIELI